jgi:hypothetical protein
MALDTLELLDRAVRALVVTDAPLRARLGAALTHHLGRLDESRLPPELQGRWRALHSAVTWAEPGEGEGSIAATLRTASDDQVARLADRVLDLRSALEEARRR